MYNEKYLYFRGQSGTDDGSDDSCCFPLSSLTGLLPASNTTLSVFFKSMKQYDGDAISSSDVVTADIVTLTITEDKHREVIQDIMDSILSNDTMITIGDDRAPTSFCSTNISAVASIVIDGANS